MNLNEKLKSERLSHKLSQAALAEKIGVSRASLSSWENGSVTPSVKYLRAYSAIFSLESDFFKKCDNSELDLSVLNENGIAELKKYYDFIISSDKFRKKY